MIGFRAFTTLWCHIGITLLIACSPVSDSVANSELQHLFEDRLSPDNALTSPDLFRELSKTIKMPRENPTLAYDIARTPTLERSINTQKDPKDTIIPLDAKPLKTPTIIPTFASAVEPTPVITIAPTYASPTATPTATDHFNKGVVLFNRGKYGDAIVEFSRSLQLAPKHSKSHWYRGSALHRSGQTQEGLKDIDMAIRFSPDYHSPYIDQGHIFTDLKQYDKATKAYTKAITLRPQESEAYYHRANLYRLLNLYKKSNSDYAKACSLSEKYCSTLAELGICSDSDMNSKHVIWGKATGIRVSVWMQGKQIAEVMTGGSTKINAPYSIDLDVCDSDGSSRVGQNIEFKLDKKWALETTSVATGEKTLLNLTLSPYR